MSNVSINLQVDRVTQPFWESANAASGYLLQNVTAQLLAFFQAQGCVLPIAEGLAEKVTSELTARVGEVLWRPGLGASWISGVIQVGDLRLDLQRHVLWRRDDEIHLSPKEFDLLAFMMLRKKIEKDPANPEYIVSEAWIGYRFRIPEALESPSFPTEPPAAFNSRSPAMRWP